MDRYEALYDFWASFGVPAYEENSVPDLEEVVFPYITYEALATPFGDVVTGAASIWTRSTSWDTADELSDTVEGRLKDGGETVGYSGGMIWVTPGSPFSQSLGDPADDQIKRKLLTINYHFL